MSGFEMGLGHEINLWRAESEKPCRICLGLEGNHAEAPARPHPYCECSVSIVTRFDGSEPQVVREFTTRERSSTRYEFLGLVRPHQGLEVYEESNWSFAGAISHRVGSVGPEIGGARGTNRTFTYDDDMEGSPQRIYDVFGIFVTWKTTVYRRTNGEKVDISEIVEEAEILLDTIWVKDGDAPYYHEGGAAGESEEGDGDVPYYHEGAAAGESEESDEDGSMEVGWDD